MRRSLAVLSLFTLASMSACASLPPAENAGSNAPAVVLHGHRISVEIAADDASRAHGLMDRTSMPADHGMLFVFPNSAVQTFWMKDTLIPLDMLFLDAHRKVVTVQANVPPCTSAPCPIYPSTQPARYVLELNGGAAAKLGTRVGDIATFINVPPAAQ
ncbi:MAG TPA: DUF192 domain-containing protein [Rhodanobacteraceae bacterium]|nr:DUF192 domain-containing protein [Rhodanobacteraceae bacterium]